MCVQMGHLCTKDRTCHVHDAREYPFWPSSRVLIALLLSRTFLPRCRPIQYCVRRSDRGTRVLVVQEMAEEPQGGELTLSAKGVDTANLGDRYAHVVRLQIPIAIRVGTASWDR